MVEITGKTAQERLTAVQDAIHAVMYGGQSYKTGARSLQRASLEQLRAMEKELKAELAAESNSRLFDDTFVAYFEGR